MKKKNTKNLGRRMKKKRRKNLGKRIKEKEALKKCKSFSVHLVVTRTRKTLILSHKF